ncbi:uncharacterized protein LTR77_008083 [Saxophila tyrrhenica]|uniref:Cytochrome P450 n=1 Tax=Saxophila tyrrhenica TaxID=1690608 RepID=A0AAV9P3Q9_9PEZI|nr:hypothetical protein LTR77_008083 [Saxophila tyrrhenica]
MPSILLAFAVLVTAYASTFVYRFTRGWIDGRKTGFPLVLLPLDPNWLPWMIVSVPWRKWLQKNLPRSIYQRVVLSIYGWEFWEKTAPYDELAAPQGDRKNFLLVSCGRLELWTCDSAIVAEVLSRPKDFNQLDIGNFILNKFGDNILTTDGDRWARHRKVVAGVINERISKSVFDETVVQARGLLDQIQTDSNGTSAIETNKAFDWAKKITMQVLSGAGMGTQLPWNNEGHEKPAPGFKQTYSQSVTHVISNIAGPLLLPQWFLLNYPSWAPGYSVLKPLGIAIEEFPIHTDRLLQDERRRAREEGGSSKSNILSQLLEASDSSEKQSAKSAPLSDRELRGDLFIFTAAGFDTTANTISYAFVLLARYPKWQDWLFEEVDDILPNDPNEELDYIATFPRATRTLAFMLEVLRLFTPLNHIAKQAQTPQPLHTPGKTYWLPANTTMYINVVPLHRDPAVWRGLNLPEGETSAKDDELHFRPNRWTNPSGSAQVLYQPAKGTYVPWSAGPRVCPGQKMGQVEFVAVFLTILRTHRIDAVALGEESKQVMNKRLDARMEKSHSLLTLQMEDIYDVKGEDDGLKLRISRRK